MANLKYEGIDCKVERMRVIDISKEKLTVMPPDTTSELLSEVEKWLSLQEHQLDRFIVAEVPELLKLGYGVDALNVLNRWLLDEVKPPAQGGKFTEIEIEKMGLAARFLGESLVRNFEGEWVLTSDEAKSNLAAPSVMLPYGRPIFEVFQEIRSVVVRADKTDLETLFGLTERVYGEWVAKGSPRVLPLA